MPLDPNGPLTQYRQQIDLHETQIADRPTTAEVIGVFVPAFYGGIGLNGPIAQSDVNATWQTVTGWNQALVATPRGVQQNFAANGIQFDQIGIYNIYFKITLEFNEVNNSRQINFRLFNQSEGTATAEFQFFVGRNQAGVNVSAQAIAEVSVANTGDLIVLQMQSPADTFLTVSNLGSVFQAFNISELQGV